MRSVLSRGEEGRREAKGRRGGNERKHSQLNLLEGMSDMAVD